MADQPVQVGLVAAVPVEQVTVQRGQPTQAAAAVEVESLGRVLGPLVAAES